MSTTKEEAQMTPGFLSQFDILDKVAKKNDRWLFVALLCIGLFAMGMVVQWGRSELAARDLKYDKLEEKFIVQLTKSNQELSAIVHDNTRAIEGNNRLLERVSLKLDISNSKQQ